MSDKVLMQDYYLAHLGAANYDLNYKILNNFERECCLVEKEIAQEMLKELDR